MKIWNAVKSIDWRNVGSRAAWTFVQAFLACFILAVEPILDLVFAGKMAGILPLIASTLIASFSAGFSALKTIIFEVLTEIKKEGIDGDEI